MLQVKERGGAHDPGTGEGAGAIKGHERSGHNAMALMNTLCMHTHACRTCPSCLIRGRSVIFTHSSAYP